MPAVTLVQTPDDPSVAETFRAAEAHFGHVPNLVRALGTNPALCKSITEFFIQALGEGYVPWAFKELVVLKTLRAIGAYHGYTAHERLAVALGNSTDRIGDLCGHLWRDSPRFTEGERHVLELVDQIAIDANDVPDDLWDRLKQNWSPAQLVELNALITTFVMVGRLGDTLGVSEPELFTKRVA